MADLYLAPDDVLTGLTFSGHIYGSIGREGVYYLPGVIGIVVDQNVEAVTLAGASSSYTYQQQGNQLVVFDDQRFTEVARIALQSDFNGTTIRFSDGAFQATISARGMTLGPINIGSGAASQLLDPLTGTLWKPPVETKITFGSPTPVVTANVGTVVTGKLNWTDARPGELPTFFDSYSEPGFSIQSDGSFTFDASIAAYQVLRKGEAQDVEDYFSIHDSRISAGASLTIRVTGIDDAPYAERGNEAVVEAGCADDGSVLAGVPRISGRVLAEDNYLRIVTAVQSDIYEAPVDFTLSGKYGYIRFSEDGRFTYALNNADPDTQALAQGAEVYETFKYRLLSVTGQNPQMGELSIKITGANDAPVAGDDGYTVYAGLKRDGLNLAANDKDDDLSKLIYSVVGVAPAGVTLDSNGIAAFDGTIDEYKNLSSGQSETVTLSYMVTDQFGLSDLATVLFTIQGVSWG